eukprot:CAMPEP_0177527520 /NCGR_PEP_ID=MMETSP0369-20130122/51689_1 /TAXON_ID=447022 ORGANISM="Scrippsiella hangoei-like, Strain SHHI-4" /NCGR_SAMPLE_ID=MMETSP0369 /ASSEMBLY_ACC=CAM_ASM_000364 /LENGTH=54 /DNA_ID=CAMNT_0019007873 /DNA_START=26 /DNA_END=187 /DNA_ORIENTATION=-
MTGKHLPSFPEYSKNFVLKRSTASDLYSWTSSWSVASNFDIESKSLSSFGGAGS